jgi:hypothetical protein
MRAKLQAEATGLTVKLRDYSETQPGREGVAAAKVVWDCEKEIRDYLNGYVAGDRRKATLTPAAKICNRIDVQLCSDISDIKAAPITNAEVRVQANVKA